jgi:hypothetical protein
MSIKELREKLVSNYTMVVRELMSNDKNATWDEILEEKENDYIEATRELTICLKQAAEDDEENKYYYLNLIKILKLNI